MPAAGDISVREEGTGGGVGAPRATPDGWLDGRRHVVLLVHGYNADTDDARRSFDAFLRMLPARFPPAGRVYWPGDADWGIFSAASYPWKIPVARDAAGHLAGFVSKLRGPGGGPIELTLVGHSLGCRVILELLEDLSWLKATRAVVRVVVLMAAAVPHDLLEVGGLLRRSALGPLHRHVYFSDDDRILRFAFPVGQAAAQLLGMEPGDSLEAVGLHGHPVSYPSRSRDLSGNRHSDYWKDRRAVRQVATLLGSAIPRALEPRTLPVSEPPTRTPPPAREPRFTRRLPRRPVPPGTADGAARGA